jgi:hypothetical protein
VSEEEIVRQHPLVEEIFASHHDHAQGDERGWSGYKGHVYRVLNLGRALSEPGPDRDDKLAIAAAFHDIDSFSSVDYLAPSIRTQDAWLQRTGRGAWADELAVVVAEHHRLTRVPSDRPHAALAEAFRRADLVDVSQGLIRFGVDRAYVKSVRQAFDVGTFFTRSVPRAVLAGLRRHPQDPLPFMRARRALRATGHAQR